MPERQPVPESEWQKFSADNEPGVEAERAKIRKNAKSSLWRREGMKPDGKELTDEEIRAEVETETRLLDKTVTPEMRRNEELLNRVEAGELTYEELDQQVLKNYQETPPSERNWQRDAGFYQLPEHDQHRELVEEGVRDTMRLQTTLRAAVSDPEKSRRLRQLLDQIVTELQNEPDR